MSRFQRRTVLVDNLTKINQALSGGMALLKESIPTENTTVTQLALGQMEFMSDWLSNVLLELTESLKPKPAPEADEE